MRESERETERERDRDRKRERERERDLCTQVLNHLPTKGKRTALFLSGQETVSVVPSVSVQWTNLVSDGLQRERGVAK